MAGGKSQPVSVDGFSFASKREASVALFAQGWDHARIAEAIGSTVMGVEQAIKVSKRRATAPAGAAPVVDTSWTEAKVEKAVRLFGLCLDEVAGAIDVPRAELQALWVKGEQPALPIAEEPAPRGNGQRAIEYEDLADPREDDPRPSRDDDEAELAAHEAEEKKHGEASVAPAPAFRPSPNPPRSAPAGAVRSLIPATGLFPAGCEVRLVDKNGRYLHESLEDFTDKRKYAWRGGRALFDIVKARMPKVIAKLQMEVVV